MTWVQWIDHFASLFGVTDDAGWQTLDAWAQTFERAGYTPEELTEATDFVLVNVEVKFWRNAAPHLGARVRAVREQQALRQQAEDAARTCGEPPPKVRKLLADIFRNKGE